MSRTRSAKMLPQLRCSPAADFVYRYRISSALCSVKESGGRYCTGEQEAAPREALVAEKYSTTSRAPLQLLQGEVAETPTLRSAGYRDGSGGRGQRLIWMRIQVR